MRWNVLDKSDDLKSRVQKIADLEAAGGIRDVKQEQLATILAKLAELEARIAALEAEKNK